MKKTIIEVGHTLGAAGTGFVVAIGGEIMTVLGLPKVPSSEKELP
jgi:formyltetrahydrofolate synthetase